MSTPTDILDRWQDPRYTGANRCSRCTLVNAAIAVVGIGAVTGVISVYSSSLTGLLSGGLVAIISASMIYFKGYLVPGTPELTKRYFPASVLSWFGKLNAEADQEPATALDFESLFMEHGLLTEYEDVDNLCISEMFNERWQSARAAIDDPEAVLRETIAVSPSTTEFSADGEGVRLTSEEQFMEWPSRAALQTDAATAAELR